jgi:hypothetical protein
LDLIPNNILVGTIHEKANDSLERDWERLRLFLRALFFQLFMDCKLFLGSRFRKGRARLE